MFGVPKGSGSDWDRTFKVRDERHSDRRRHGSNEADRDGWATAEAVADRPDVGAGNLDVSPMARAFQTKTDARTSIFFLKFFYNLNPFDNAFPSPIRTVSSAQWGFGRLVGK